MLKLKKHGSGYKKLESKEKSEEVVKYTYPKNHVQQKKMFIKWLKKNYSSFRWYLHKYQEEEGRKYKSSAISLHGTVNKHVVGVFLRTDSKEFHLVIDNYVVTGAPPASERSCSIHCSTSAKKLNCLRKFVRDTFSLLEKY